jgi:hypothetical protein
VPMKIALATLYTAEIARMAELTNPSKRAYCERWGYDFACVEGTLDPDRPPAWSKVLLVRRLLDQYDWVFWLDADALIMNPDVALESLLDPRYSLILVKQPGPDPFGNLHLNTGSFFARSDEWSKGLMDDLYRQSQFIDHPCWEQEAFMHLYRHRPDVRERVKVEVDARKFNSIANSYVKGDFVFHAINPMRTEAGKIQLIERVREDDARIPGSVESGFGVGLMYYDEEEQDLLEFTVASLLSDSRGIPLDSLHFVRTFERGFGEKYGWEHISRFRLERMIELVRSSRDDVVMLARPGTQFFGGWRRNLLVALGNHDLGIASDTRGQLVGDVVVMRNNAATRALLERCRQAFGAVAAGDRNAIEDLVDRLLVEELRRGGADPAVSWIGFGPDVIRIGPARDVNLLDALSFAAYSPGGVVRERQEMRAVRSGYVAIVDRLRQTVKG